MKNKELYLQILSGLKGASFIFLSGLILLILFNQEASSKPDSTSASFLKIGIGGRPLGMGGAYTALADDASSLYWNPAGLSLLKEPELLVFYSNLSNDIHQGFLAYAQPLGPKNGLGLSLNYLLLDGGEKRSGFSLEPEGTVEASDLAITFGYSQRIFSNISLGASCKMIQERLEEDNAQAFAFDLGLLYHPGRFSFGASLNNFGSRLGESRLPEEVKAGIAYRLLKNRLTLGVSLGASLDTLETARTHLGAEYFLFDKLALRGGFEVNKYRGNLGKDTGLTLGLGINFGNFGLDCAFLPYGEIGNTYRMSLVTKFGESKEPIIEPPIEEEAVEPKKVEFKKKVVVFNFVNNTGRSEFDWLIKNIPNLLTTELANSNYLVIVDVDWVEELLKKGLDERKIAQETGADILIKGSFTMSEKTFRIDAKAVDAQDRIQLAACSVEGGVKKIFDLVSKLAGKLDRDLFFRLNPKVSESAYKPLPGVEERPVYRADLWIEDIEIADIFPSKYNYYTQNPIVKMTLTNNTDTDFDNIKVQINIPRFMDLPSEVEVSQILANSSREVLLKVILDNIRLLEVNENTLTPAEIKAIYYKQGKEEVITFTKSVVFFDRNAIDWEDPISIATFVTPKDDLIKTFARRVLGSVQIEEAALPQRILTAASIFEALSLYPLTYISDPSSSFRGRVFDYVQYSSETLEFKSGDCDDFAVLYASLLENVGISTKLVNTPNHLFLLFDSGITRKNSYLVSLEEKDFVLIEDKVFIPVETTKIDSSFMKAWASGVEEYQRWQSTPSEMTLIDLHVAWQIYPPMVIPAKTKEIRLPEAAQLLVRLKENDKEFGHKSETAYEKALSEHKQKPATSETYNQIGMLQVYAGRYTEAKETFLEGLAQDITSAALYNNLGNIYLLEGDFTEAKRNYGMTLDCEGNEPGVLVNLGLTSFLEGRDEEVLDYFEQALSISSLEEVYYRLGLSVAYEELQAPDAKERLVGKVKRLLKIAAERVKRPITPEGIGVKGAEESIDLSTLLYWKRGR